MSFPLSDCVCSRADSRGMYTNLGLTRNFNLKIYMSKVIISCSLSIILKTTHCGNDQAMTKIQSIHWHPSYSGFGLTKA